MKKIFLILIFSTSIFLFSSCREFNSTTKNGEIEYTEDNTALETGVSDTIKDLASLDYLNSYDGNVVIKVTLFKENEENYKKVISKIKKYIINFHDDEWYYIKIEVKNFDPFELTF
ncbi:MAG: hypothetical protein Q4B52_04595 [Tissierellia bacterium]|nr:hypothetical protein [Tissierellia bacterium]